MLDHFTQYVGSAPDASPAVLCGIAHMQTSEGVWYPRGGTGAVPRALAKLAEELGVELRTGCGVRRILVEGGAVAGVETDAGERVPLAALVCNADSVRAHRELLEGAPARRFLRRRKYEPACSGVVLYLGLERGYGQMAHHNFVFSRDPHEEFAHLYRKGEPAPDPTCYVCAPARTEPDVAPPGGEALYVLVHAPYLRPGHDWGRTFPAYRRTILRKLAETVGLDDLERRIRFEARLTPEDIRDRYHVLDGAIYGLASHGRWTGAFKPANRSPDVRGLYLAGGAAHPGPGMPMVLMSGWIAADALDRDGVNRVGAASRAAPVRLGSPDLPVPAVGAASRAAPVRLGSPDLPQRPDEQAQGLHSLGPDPALPPRSAWLVPLFQRYARRYLARHLHAVRLHRAGRPDVPDGAPLVVVLNHPSWWDPLVCAALADLFPGYRHYAPIDAAALGKYRFFARLGFFGIEPGPGGARTFLRTGRAVLAQPHSALWVTAQGAFTDPRVRPVKLRPGVAHLLARLDRAVVLPLALEYPFWQERSPEALAHFGAALVVRGARSVVEWLALLESALAGAQDELAAAARRQDPADFAVLLGGKAGVGGVYDLWRRFKALLRGERFRPGHGAEELRQAPLGGTS
jgi:1-acyl-sn-glycerol-3-phosphate acyltransferase